MASHASVELVKALQAQVNGIESEITVSEVITIPSPTMALIGLSTSVISIGKQFNLFGTGHLNTGVTLTNGTTYYLLTQNVAGYPKQFTPLDYYLGDPAVATLWITSGTNAYSLPLFFDATGAYFRPTTQLTGIQAGATFSFTMLLILAPAV